MGIGRKSHGAKENKETQSPVLRIFRDMVQQEKTDPEKVALLKDKQKEKKRKSFLSRPKYDQKSYDSSSTDRYRRMKQNKITVQGVKEEKNEGGSEAFHGGKKDSWWFKRDKAEKKPDDTCSCVSCALKKLIGSEYICVACLLVLFSVSVAVAFLVVFRSSPMLEVKPDGKGVEKKIQLIKRQLNQKDLDGNSWSPLSTSLPHYPGYLGSDFAETKLRGSSNQEDLDGISSDLSNVLGFEKLADSQNSDKLRDFYKKLIQTDVQIKKLKESLTHNYQTDTDIKSISERFKRSMAEKFHFKNEFKSEKEKTYNNQNKNTVIYNVDKKVFNKKRGRRARDNSTKLTGFVVEKEKYYVQYEPIVQRRNFPKCYHANNGKSHERTLKHPFYKNSQRLDEMLYQNLNNGKTTPKDNYFSKNVYKDMRKPHPDPRYRIKNNDYIEKDEDYNNMPNELNMTIAKNMTDMSPDYFENKQINIPQSTIESILNAQTFKTAQGRIEKKLQRYQVGRKLMQFNEEDDEALGYDDLREVLTEDQETHDETDKQVERIKRTDDKDIAPTNFIKYNPSPGIYNPNWKGPMPLYPDEINAMIKQAAFHNLNIQVPVETKDIKIEKDKAERDITDTEYIENYLDDKNSKLVNMAQAYSDYGVLDTKQETNSATTKGLEKPEGFKIFDGIRNGIFDRTKKAGRYDPEGVRIEYKPGTVSEKNDVKSLLNSIHKHIKFVKPHPCVPHPTPTHLKSESEIEKLYPPPDEHLHLETTKPQKEAKKVIFTLKKPSRSLKAIEDENKVQVVQSKNSSNLDFSEFFAMMADWFYSMARLSGELKSNGTVFKNNLSDVTNELNIKENKSEISYPVYDSEMIENIGHRSRVLMSVDDKTTVAEAGNKRDATFSNITDNYNNSTLTKVNNTNIKTTNNDNKVIAEQNKTVVKRSIGSNFIFWNDLYDDDEYGMKIDYLENVMRGKHAAKYDYKGALLKSKDWVQEKFKTMTEKIREDINQKLKTATDKKESKKPIPKMVPHKVVSYRQIRSIDNNGEEDVKKSFAILNANLRHVCRQAAEAVRNTRKIEARDENEGGTRATGLMQQLVRLMSDLVDIQVQQKTCAKLPPDLRDFLEWLTAPPESHPIVENLPSLTEYNHMFPDERFEKSTDFTYNFPTLTEDTHQDDRTECLGSIRAVQDLIQQYEGMTDEDKSKMAGVKEYLENQLEFLNRKLNILNVYDSFSYKKREARNKRSLKKPRYRRLFDQYLFGKKQTTTTTVRSAKTKAKNNHDNRKQSTNIKEKDKDGVNLIKKDYHSNEIKKVGKNKENKEKDLKKVNNESAIKTKNENKKEFVEYSDNEQDNEKYFNEKLNVINDVKIRNERNLRDIYFRALNEAKKTTVKKN